MNKPLKRVHFSGIGSTNTWAKMNAHLLNPEEITLVTADTQSVGRGRFNRKWISPPKENLYASYCFFVPKERQDLYNISQILSLSAIKTLETYSLHPKIKWPNDILADGKKLGGILTELVACEVKILVVAGIGLNINMPSKGAQEIDQPSTSLFIENRKEHSVGEVLETLSKHFQSHLTQFLAEGFALFHKDYTAHLVHQSNDTMQIFEGEKLWQGTFESINSDGSLNLKTPSGEIKRFLSGEIGL